MELTIIVEAHIFPYGEFEVELIAFRSCCS